MLNIHVALVRTLWAITLKERAAVHQRGRDRLTSELRGQEPSGFCFSHFFNHPAQEDKPPVFLPWRILSWESNLPVHTVIRQPNGPSPAGFSCNQGLMGTNREDNKTMFLGCFVCVCVCVLAGKYCHSLKAGENNYTRANLNFIMQQIESSVDYSHESWKFCFSLGTRTWSFHSVLALAASDIRATGDQHLVYCVSNLKPLNEKKPIKKKNFKRGDICKVTGQFFQLPHSRQANQTSSLRVESERDVLLERGATPDTRQCPEFSETVSTAIRTGALHDGSGRL